MSHKLYLNSMVRWNIRSFGLIGMYILIACCVNAGGKDDISSFIHATTNSTLNIKSYSPFPPASRQRRDSLSPRLSRNDWSSWNDDWSSWNSWSSWNTWSSWNAWSSSNSWSSRSSWSEDNNVENKRSNTNVWDIFLIVGGIVFGVSCIFCCCLPSIACEKEDYRQQLTDNECPENSAERNNHTETSESRQSSTGPREPVITTPASNSHRVTPHSGPNVRNILNTSTVGSLMDEYISMRNNSGTSVVGNVNLELQSGLASLATISPRRNVPTAPPLLRTRVNDTITSLLDEYMATRNQAAESDGIQRQSARSNNQSRWSEPPDYSACTSDRLQSGTSVDDRVTVTRATYPLPALTPLLEEQNESYDGSSPSDPLAPISEDCSEDAPPSYASLFGAS